MVKSKAMVGKQRNGLTRIVTLFFHKQYTRFDSCHRFFIEYLLRLPCCMRGVPDARRIAFAESCEYSCRRILTNAAWAPYS